MDNGNELIEELEIRETIDGMPADEQSGERMRSGRMQGASGAREREQAAGTGLNQIKNETAKTAALAKKKGRP